MMEEHIQFNKTGYTITQELPTNEINITAKWTCKEHWRDVKDIEKQNEKIIHA